MLPGAGVAGETRGRRISRGELHYVKSTNGVRPWNFNRTLRAIKLQKVRGGVFLANYKKNSIFLLAFLSLYLLSFSLLKKRLCGRVFRACA